MILSNIVGLLRSTHGSKIKKLKSCVLVLNKIKNKKKYTKKSINLEFSNLRTQKKQTNKKKLINKENLIKYIINVHLSLTNSYVSVTDVKGAVIISLSGGAVGLQKRQKKIQPIALITIFKELFLKTRFLKGQCVAIHFKNVRPHFEKLIIKTLKSKVLISVIRSYNLHPHNGCRPKKLKRFKHRTKK